MRSKAKDLVFTEKEIAYLEKVSRSKTDEVRRVNRANMLLLAYRGVTINEIAQRYNLTTTSVTELIKKTLAFGVETSLNDLPRSGTPAKIGLCLFLSIQPRGSYNIWAVALETFGQKAASFKDNINQKNNFVNSQNYFRFLLQKYFVHNV